MGRESSDGDRAYSLVDLATYNPWWEDESALPDAGYPRADLYWRVRNMLDRKDNFYVIPGSASTGTTRTIKQMIRALIKGAEAGPRVEDLFAAEIEDVAPHFEGDPLGEGDTAEFPHLYPDAEDEPRLTPEGFDRLQVCYIPCADPLARLSGTLLNKASELLLGHATTIDSTVRDFFFFFDQVHHLDNWHQRLRDKHEELTDEFPDKNWTFVATVPAQTLMTEPGIPQNPFPHRPQKYRDFLVSETRSETPQLRRQPNRDERDRLSDVRKGLESLADSESTADGDEVIRELEAIRDEVEAALETVEPGHSDFTDWYLLDGGLGPALDGDDTASSGDDSTLVEGTEPTQDAHRRAIDQHATTGIEHTIYQDIESLAGYDGDTIPNVEDIRDIHSLCTFVARNGFEQTSYAELESALSADGRTIREKYIPPAVDFYLLGKSSRTELDRERTFRLHLRSSAYVHALSQEQDIDEILSARRSDLLKTALADHLDRPDGPLYGAYELEYYQRNGVHVEYVLSADDWSVPFLHLPSVSNDIDDVFEAFRGDEEVEPSQLEVCIGSAEREIELEQVADDRYRLWLPDWLLLTIC